MDQQGLKAFIAVAEHQSFSLAAEALFITQPAVSKRIKLLEQQLDCKLLDRSVKKISLTQNGLALLPRAKKIIQDMEDSKQLMSDLNGHTMGTLSLATSHHIGLHRLPPVLQQYVERHADVDLDIQFMDSEDACHAVEQGTVEMAVVTLPTKQWHNIRTQAVWLDHLCVVAHIQHPLSDKSTVSLQALLEYPAILPSRGTFTRNIIEQTLKDHPTPLKINLETNYLETIKMMVSIGLGWSILPRSMLDDSLITLPVEHFKAQRQLGLVLNKQRSISNPAKAFISLLTN